jgi:polyribonucleotide nucleotidyltransferase
MEFGAFVNFFGPKDGLVHISNSLPSASRRSRTSSRKATR